MIQPETTPDFDRRIATCADRFEQQLLDFLPLESPVENLHDGLRYSLGLDTEDRRRRGKRLRPVLALLTCEALGGSEQAGAGSVRMKNIPSALTGSRKSRSITSPSKASSPPVRPSEFAPEVVSKAPVALRLSPTIE